MVEFTVEFQDEDTCIWSISVSASSEKKAVKKVVQDSLSSKNLEGVYAFVYESNTSIEDAEIFDANDL